MNHQVTIRPRTLANLLDDLRHARRDYDDALADSGTEGRVGEAETRLDDMREEFEARFAEVNGLTIGDLMKAREDCLL